MQGTKSKGSQHQIQLMHFWNYLNNLRTNKIKNYTDKTRRSIKRGFFIFQEHQCRELQRWPSTATASKAAECLREAVQRSSSQQPRNHKLRVVKFTSVKISCLTSHCRQSSHILVSQSSLNINIHMSTSNPNILHEMYLNYN